MKMTYRVPEPIATYSDVDFLKYGGQLLLPNRDEIGNPYLEVIEPPTENLDTTWVIYRFDVDRLKKVTVKRTYHLVPFGYEPATWPHPVHMYNEWFVDSLPNVAESMDCPEPISCSVSIMAGRTSIPTRFTCPSTRRTSAMGSLSTASARSARRRGKHE
jgi:hypothetical protein